MGFWSKMFGSSKRDDAANHFNLGIDYLTGDDVKHDIHKAFDEFLIAAKLGDADAQVNIGLMYHGGKGIEVDYNSARKWYEKAAAQNSAEAFFNLGVIYSEGQGVQRDMVQSLMWFEKAAGLGHSQAQYNIGVLHEDGWLDQIDIVEAKKWYKMAADQGHAAGHMKLETLELSENIDSSSKSEGFASEHFSRQRQIIANIPLIDTNCEKCGEEVPWVKPDGQELSFFDEYVNQHGAVVICCRCGHEAELHYS